MNVRADRWPRSVRAAGGSYPLPMRSAAVRLVVLLLLGGAACSGTETDVEERASVVPETIRYVALGDSLATGFGAETSYVEEYARWIGERTGSHVQVTNLAVDGWTSTDLLRALLEDERMRGAVSDAHVVTWDIGGNDLLAALWSFLEGSCGGNDGRACIREALAGAARNGDAILDELIELREGDASGVRTLDLYLPFADHPLAAPYVGELRPYLDQFNDHLREDSLDHGVPVAHVRRAFHGPQDDEDPLTAGRISPDGVHPSSRGHEVIAAELAALGLELGRVG